MPTIETVRGETNTRTASALTWIFKIVPAVFFLNAGISKLTGAARQIALFDAIGWGHWFRYTTGGIEIACAILLLVPVTSLVGALGLTGLSLGALLTLVLLGKSLLPAIVALAWSILLVVLQRRQIAGYARILPGSVAGRA